MFENNNQQSGAEDMFAEIDGGSPEPHLSSGPVNMGNPAFTQQSQTAPAKHPQTNQSNFTEKKEYKQKNDVKYLIIGIISLLVVLIVAWIVYQQILKPKYLQNKAVLNMEVPADNYDNQDVNGTVENNNDNSGNVNNANVNNDITETATPAIITTSANPDEAGLDTDSDGLPDAEEKVLGTNINLADTDGDGLSDKEEVKIWKTNPLEPDTDGDGYPDGKEVEGKYNPNGPGKLYEVKETK